MTPEFDKITVIGCLISMKLVGWRFICGQAYNLMGIKGNISFSFDGVMLADPAIFVVSCSSA